MRTLLLNLAATANAAPGEEYVDPSFVPVALPQPLRDARAALFGAGADRTGVNLNLARLLLYLHGSPLAADATLGDARITYDPTAPTNVFDTLGPAAVVVSGPAAAGWGGSPAFPAAGRGYGGWTVVTDGAGHATVSPADSPPATGPVTATTAGDAVDLPGSALRLVVPTGATGQWAVTLTAAPPYGFAQAAIVGDPAAVFRADRSDAEARWWAAWRDDARAPLRAAAFALALANRVEDVLQGRGYS